VAPETPKFKTEIKKFQNNDELKSILKKRKRT
jgi:hypothetical protein